MPQTPPPSPGPQFTSIFAAAGAQDAQPQAASAPTQKSVVQRNPKRIGILGTLLTPLISFAIAASIMVALELSGFGVLAALTGAMPFVAALGAGVPALLAFAAIIAATALVVYAISVAIAHVATRNKPVAAATTAPESAPASRNEDPDEAPAPAPAAPGQHRSPTAGHPPADRSNDPTAGHGCGAAPSA